jgi:glycosyltransferase involved in cell wall biosynthesis
MAITVVAPSVGAYSEVWLKRQIGLLSNQIDCVLTVGGTHDINSVSDVPVLSLNPHFRKSFAIMNKLGLVQPEKELLRTFAKKLSKSGGPIIVHYIELALRLMPVLKNTGRKVFVYCHGFDVTWDLRLANNPNQRKHPDDYIDQVKELATFASFIANSRATIAKLTDLGINQERINLVYFSAPPVDTVKSKDLKNFKIVSVGRLVDFKGPDLLIKSFELACDLGLPNATLTLAGDGNLRTTCELLRARSSHKEKIKIVGSASENQVKELLSEAHLYAAHNCTGPLTKQEEAYGVSIIEAMAHSLAVVTGNSGGVAETVKHGETGYLFAPGDVVAQANLFLQLEKDRNLLGKLGINGRNRVLQKFSEVNEQKQLLEALKS